jgi:ElaB/YqjD/DUF883 family membrane-anchored ribosome-binding protein
MIETQEKKSAEAAVNGAIDSAKEAVVSGYETAKSRVVEGYEKVAGQAHEMWDKAADTSIHDAEASVVRYVRHNPGKSLLVAAGTGLLIGILLRGRIG